MRTTRKTMLVSGAAVLLAVGIAWTLLGRAQGGAPPQPPPQRVMVVVTQVKPDMITTYEDLIKNVANPALKKAGVPWRYTWATASGQGFTRISATPLANYAELDQPNPLQRALGADGVASYNAKLRPTIESAHTYMDTVRQDLSILSNSSTPPAFAVVQTFQVVAGKGDEFTSSMTSDYLPNYKKAGVKDFWVYAGNFGGPGGHILTVRPIAKYAELDQPGLLNRAGLSAEAAAKIGARRAAVSTVIDNEVMRFVGDLSFGTPTPQVRATN
jgi:hypothetical protein